MRGLSRGVGKIDVAVSWDPSPLGTPPHNLDIIAATYTAEAPEPVYLVHLDSRSPDGTIHLQRNSRTGQGFGADELLTLEFDRLSSAYHRVVVGVAIEQSPQRVTFGEVASTRVRVLEGHIELARSDFAEVAESTAATVAEFNRDAAGAWQFSAALRGFDADPASFARLMGGAP